LSHSELKIWDTQTGHELLKLKDARFTDPTRFSPDGTRIYVGGEDGLYVFDSRSLHPSSSETP
jgi:WD40 repeat protein